MALRLPSRDVDNVGVYLAKVTRIVGAECYVEVPSLAPGYEYGPSRYPAINAAGRTTDYTAGTQGGDPAHAHPEHRHNLATDALAVGDRVAVAFLEGGRDELVVLVRLA